MDTEDQKPKITVGVGVMIFKDGKVLIGKRVGNYAAGEYCFTGGKLEYMESFEDCAKRETREEAGIEIKNIRFNCLSNVTAYAPKHFVDVELIADWESGEPKVMEPDKLVEWKWYGLNEVPDPLFKFCVNAFEAHKTGKNFFDVN